MVCAALAFGCGGRTAPRVDGDEDGGVGFDAGSFDGGRDAGGRDGGFDAGPPEDLVVDCGRREQFTSPRRSIALVAEADSPDGVVSQTWELVDQPRGSRPDVEPGVPGAVTLTPDVEGDFLMQFTATDGAGRVGSCEVVVRSVVGPPIAICPEEPLATFIGMPIEVVGDGFDDDEVVSYQWEIVTEPPGSGATLIRRRMPITTFETPTRGDYVLRLTVTDPDDAVGTCEVPILVTGPPEVVCPDTIRAPTRQRVEVAAMATDDVGLASETWELVSAPDGSAASPRPNNPTRFIPDRQGEYRLRFTAVDVEGLSASCETTVIGTPTPPSLTCPMLVTTLPLTPVDVSASAEDDGRITRWRWTVSSRPDGSDARSPSPSDEPMTVFTPDVAGVYELTVTVTDDDGETASCVTVVEAGNVDGLRIEMSWDTTGTDMDLHLLRPGGSMWTTEEDCHFRNCDPPDVLEWFTPGPDDNPRLDIDDTDGLGPENINITTPDPGTYRVAVHNWSGAGPNATTVRIYCGGSTTTPQQVIGPVDLRGGSDDFWRVADVEITRTGCRITPLTTPDGRPNISPLGTTQGMR